MAKWLAGAGVVLLVLLFVMWYQLKSSSATPVPVTVTPEVKAPVPATMPAAAKPAAVPAEPVAVAVADEAPKKMDPQSDEFFKKHDEMVVPRLSREAVKCIEGSIEKPDDRNKSVVIKFKQKVRDGRVQITDVEVERSTLTDPALEACFLQQVRNSGWLDQAMPDWEQEDQIKLGYRQLKKYTRANIEYVGGEAPQMMPKPASH
jgi:hypothetical protein